MGYYRPSSCFPLLAAAADALWAQRRGFTAAAWAAALPVAASLTLLVGKVPEILVGEKFLISWPWLPELGFNLSFRLDGLGLLFALLILGIGLLVILYARYYLFSGGSHRQIVCAAHVVHDRDAGPRAV